MAVSTSLLHCFRTAVSTAAVRRRPAQSSCTVVQRGLPARLSPPSSSIISTAIPMFAILRWVTSDLHDQSESSASSGHMETIFLPSWRGKIIGRGVSGYVEFLPPDKGRKCVLLGPKREESLRDINTGYALFITSGSTRAWCH